MLRPFLSRHWPGFPPGLPLAGAAACFRRLALGMVTCLECSTGVAKLSTAVFRQSEPLFVGRQGIVSTSCSLPLTQLFAHAQHLCSGILLVSHLPFSSRTQTFSPENSAGSGPGKKESPSQNARLQLTRLLSQQKTTAKRAGEFAGVFQCAGVVESLSFLAQRLFPEKDVGGRERLKLGHLSSQMAL